MREIAKIEYSLIILKCITYDGKRHTAWENTLCDICIAIAGVVGLLIRTFVPIDLPWLYNNKILDFLGVVVMFSVLYILANWLIYILLKYRLSRRSRYQSNTKDKDGAQAK